MCLIYFGLLQFPDNAQCNLLKPEPFAESHINLTGPDKPEPFAESHTNLTGVVCQLSHAVVCSTVYCSVLGHMQRCKADPEPTQIVMLSCYSVSLLVCV